MLFHCLQIQKHLRYNFRTSTSDKTRENVIFLRVCLNDAMSYTHTFCNILTHDFGDQPDIPATDLAKVHGSYFSFQSVPHDWCNKHRGMCYPVCGMVHIKEPLLLIGKSSPCGGSGFPLSLSEWSFTMSDAI